jgi:hypothetical protein
VSEVRICVISSVWETAVASSALTGVFISDSSLASGEYVMDWAVRKNEPRIPGLAVTIQSQKADLL